MSRKFGALLRQLRGATGKSMGQLARHLGVTTPYLSDVERGNRTPLTNSRINDAAGFLGLNDKDFDSLLSAAAESRGFFELAADSGPIKNELGAALARGWAHLDDEKARRIQQILDEGEP